MAEYFAGGHLRFVNGEWRDDNGDAIDAMVVTRCKDYKHRTETATVDIRATMGFCHRHIHTIFATTENRGKNDD